LFEDVPKEIFYGLQVGIYNERASAESEKEKFLAKRMRTTVAEKQVAGKLRYAVVIGHYSSIEAAEAAKIIVGQQCGCEPLIYEK
jgi:cell division protein FtsN